MRDYRTEDRVKVGQILDNFNQLEGLISEIITAYVCPVENKRYFMYSFLLNNSIISFGAKIKVLLRINSIEKYIEIKSHDLHRLLSLRNAVAHKDSNPKYGFEQSASNDAKGKAYLVLEKMRSDGTVDHLNQEEAYSEFNILCEKLLVTLIDMKNKVSEGCV